MATCKELRREHRNATREEKTLRKAVREANAAVVAATSKLPPHYVTTADAAAARDRVKPLVAHAQAASNQWWQAADRLSNASRAVEAQVCQRKKK